MKFHQNGQIDNSFHQNGKLELNIGDRIGTIQDLTLQKNGKLIIAGNIGNPRSYFVVRLDINGNLDTSFGNNGYSIYPLDTRNNGGGLIRIALGPTVLSPQMDPSIFALFSWQSTRVQKLDSNGNLDFGFGQNGGAIGSVTELWTTDIAVTNDGTIFVSGTRDGGDSRQTCRARTMFLEAFTPEGTQDLSFGNGRIDIRLNNQIASWTTNPNASLFTNYREAKYGRSLIIQGNTIILAGSAESINGANHDTDFLFMKFGLGLYY